MYSLVASTVARARNAQRLILIAAFTVSIVIPVAHAANGKALDLPTIFASDEFASQLPTALKWLPSGDQYAFLEQDENGQRIVKRSVGSEQLATALTLNDISGLPSDFRLTDFYWQPANELFLLQGAVTTDWQGYRYAAWYVYQSSDKSLRPLGTAGQQLQLVKLAPNGKHAGFVFENNVYVADLSSGKVKPVTQDGNGDIFNGVFDYGSSEFGPLDAWRWSPDSSHIAFWRMDATDVKFYPMIDELHSYSEVRRFHYPNAGEKHSVNKVGVYSLASADTQWVDVGHDPDDYLPQMHWDAKSNGVYIQHLARDQDTLKLWYAEVGNGSDKEVGKKEVKLVLTDTDPAWIDITNDLQSLTDGSVIWTSEKSGFRHIYRIAESGEEQVVTKGNWSVDAVLGVDEADGWVYFYAKKDSLIDQHVYRVNLGDARLEKLTARSGWHIWQLSPDARYALAIHSDARTPQSLALVSAAGESLQTLVSNSVPALNDYALTHTEFITFKTDDGIELNGFFIKPPNFDPSKKYPVVSYGYGNAGSQVVVNRWGTQRGPTQDLWHRYLAQQGYVIFAMDNRTTTGRGKKAKNLTYGEYGKYAVLDYIQGVDYLKTLPWIDDERIGFWGWSGGGYLAAALMTKAAPRFKVAVSVAPVIDLTRYQAVGVERWMGSPAENPEGYAAMNLINFADKLEGKLMLVHGTGDENVKYAFTLQFAESLIKANKQFDMLIYPNQRHGISDYRLHVFSTITRYFDENL
ncbi:S9 family peptidase [Arenicella xantha]|uniref:Dipeptidyl-peptidase-4 n=1 Tax=Arenicella xantha TaxID=644221 RepID=A0A395JSP8_9GAMM|nr:DPP IV N-terminal domain-containing protein [Arenicella xantha]RBP53565.1 dipeptidyl-peptidase-4 [Arenicella xantha]